MNALPARIPNSSPPIPSDWERPSPPPELASGPMAIVAAASPLSGKIRGLVARHPAETLNVIRRWMEDRARGG